MDRPLITFRQRLDLIGHGLNSLVEPPPVTSKPGIGPIISSAMVAAIGSPGHSVAASELA
jgi:hypothetical protein